MQLPTTEQYFKRGFLCSALVIAKLREYKQTTTTSHSTHYYQVEVKTVRYQNDGKKTNAVVSMFVGPLILHTKFDKIL